MAVEIPNFENFNSDVVLFCPQNTNGERIRKICHRLNEPFLLNEAKNLWIVNLPPKLSAEVMDACEPKGEYGTSRPQPIRQYGCLYAFVKFPVEEGARSFSKDLYKVVQYSRIIHPTSIGFEYSAMIRQLNGERIIRPYKIVNLNPYAFVVNSNENCLLPEHLLEFCILLKQIELSEPLSRRMSNALWSYIFSAHIYYADQRWLNISSGMEGLTKIRDEKNVAGRWFGSTDSFVKRWTKIVEHLQFDFSETELSEFYKLRSEISHGMSLPDLKQISLYAKAEQLLRTVLRKAFENSDFKAYFDDDESLRARFQIDK